MYHKPHKNPKQAMVLIATIVGIGIFGGLFVHRFFMIFALIFWMQYTAMLSYLQFKHGSKYALKSFTHFLLNPEVRFFIFEFLGTIGLIGVVKYGWYWLGTIVLVAWFLFALNFYRHYTQFRKYE